MRLNPAAIADTDTAFVPDDRLIEPHRVGCVIIEVFLRTSPRMENPSNGTFGTYPSVCCLKRFLFQEI
jgi:hypothetical protein